MSEVTPLETFCMASRGKLVEIPGFAPGETLTVRLRQPNLLTLVRLGKIPNPLLTHMLQQSPGAKADTAVTPEKLRMTAEMLDLFCEAALIEPTYRELKENGVELTQEQMSEIANFAQGGVTTWESFRDETRNVPSGNDGENLGNPSE